MSQVRIPKLRRQTNPKGNDRAYALFNGRRIYFGPWDTPESTEAYGRYLAEWTAAGGVAPVAHDDLSVIELVDSFTATINRDYRESPAIVVDAELATRKLREIYGSLNVADFGPVQLKAVREALIDDGLSISTVNRRVTMLKRCFKHGAENGLISGEAFHRVNALSNLKPGRCRAKPSRIVKPCNIQDVEATLEYVTAPVRAAVLLQRHTGARAGEILGLRKNDIDTSGPVWLAVLSLHKTAQHGHQRVIAFGKEAQAILRPLLLSKRADEFIIAPLDGIADAAQKKREEARQRILESGGDPTEAQIGRRPDQKPNTPKTSRTVGTRYASADYARAIRRGVEALNAARLARGEKPIPYWHSHQLRHLFATEARAKYGIEITRILLGHSTANMTQVYAEADMSILQKIFAEIG